ncbi:polysaccharide deacetylase family protein [Pelosinus propionicus]|uniref:Polysaccharide deacetylase family sporulation protein PdaB n=1 Tax=Pelosinus propionicus DSM 13327 TaxID=1123291 RepID=A0A1I4J9Q2_9FIRM|nr:polysaccharide deacetylase family protein [Pelosinus propionicus]SFL63328.1 polysaccharide deacetylase family sporulation protein PdaB [Pelosinus propionicus DSM 13327]
MFDLKIRLINMLGLLTIVVIVGLVLDYRNVLKKPMRMGMSLAVLGITAGIFLTLSAVLPENDVFGRVFSNTKTTQKVVALTFDDGPYPPYTEQVLDVLKEYNVPATFFVVGKNVEKYPELVKRIADEGHQLGNHTYHHIDLLKANRKVIAEEIDNTNQAILAAAGIKPRLMRPPHGFRDPVVMEMMAERNLKVVEWSVMSRDWTNPGVDVIVERTVKGVKNGSIILLHDGDGITSQDSRMQSVEAARRIIQILSKQGYTFVTVDEILEKTEDVKG